MTASHLPVMVERVMHLLNPRSGGRIIDATLGLGGHSEVILRALGPEGSLIGLDRDPQMLRLAEKRIRPCGGAIRLVHARLSALREVAHDAGVKHVDGILFDLGLCSAQIDARARGFSFEPGPEPAPLDMRMDQAEGETAAELLERLDEAELAALLREGDVPAPRRVARALRARRPIRTTQELVEAVRACQLPRRRHHPATLVFQALRLAVNDELRELESALESAVNLLAPGGRLAVLSYHSGEDRRVKAFLAREARGCICPPDLPRCGCGHSPRIKILERGRGPDPEEVLRNPRARSARLRGGERW
jgi:16S rRNA (cytosine1402-N4)-methyltransferase